MFVEPTVDDRRSGLRRSAVAADQVERRVVAGRVALGLQVRDLGGGVLDLHRVALLFRELHPALHVGRVRRRQLDARRAAGCSAGVVLAGDLLQRALLGVEVVLRRRSPAPTIRSKRACASCVSVMVAVPTSKLRLACASCSRDRGLLRLHQRQVVLRGEHVEIGLRDAHDQVLRRPGRTSPPPASPGTRPGRTAAGSAGGRSAGRATASSRRSARRAACRQPVACCASRCRCACWCVVAPSQVRASAAAARGPAAASPGRPAAHCAPRRTARRSPSRRGRPAARSCAAARAQVRAEATARRRQRISRRAVPATFIERVACISEREARGLLAVGERREQRLEQFDRAERAAAPGACR